MAPYYHSPDSMLTSQANLIRKLEYVGDQPYGGRAEMVTISLEAGQVVKGLINMGFTLNQPALNALAKRGRDLLDSIRFYTPTGPPRDLPEGLDVESGNSAPRGHLETPNDSMNQEGFLHEAQATIDALHRQSDHTPLSRVDKMELEEAEALLRMGAHGGQPRPTFTWGDEPGSLWNSIAVRPGSAMGGGHIELDAYSNNYYSGFVNDGFDHGLMPILRFAGPDNKLLKNKFRRYTTLDVRELGQAYPIWSTFHQGAGGDAADQLTSGFSYFGDQLTPGGGVVDFADRSGGEQKHEPGVHMFERGFETWFNHAMPGWKRDLERLVEQAWDEGSVWHALDKGPSLRVAKGVPAGGQFAKVPRLNQ